MKQLIINRYHEKAYQRAAEANKAAKQARDAQSILKRTQFILSHWEDIMTGAGVKIKSFVFLITCIIEILVSYEMYRVMLRHINNAPIVVIICGATVAGVGAIISMHLGKVLSPNLFKWEVFNKMYIENLENDQPMLEMEAEQLVKQQTKKEALLGLIGFILLVGTVGAFSWERSYLTELANSNNPVDISTISKLIPVIFITIEVYAGIYIHYLLMRWQFIRRQKRALKIYEKAKMLCASETHTAYALLLKAQESNEKFTINKDLHDVCYRMTFRSKFEEQFTDEVIAQQCQIKLHGSAEDIVNLRVMGIIDSGQISSPGFTDSYGVATLHWNNKKSLKAIDVNGHLYNGPFEPNAIYEFNITPSRFLHKTGS